MCNTKLIISKLYIRCGQVASPDCKSVGSGDPTTRSDYRIIIITTSAILFLLLSSSFSFATIINIPDDYATIQAGINVSTDGDTVLVQPGDYGEFINFNGRNIILASLFLFTNNPYYIDSTIIFCPLNRSDMLISFESGEDSTSAIIGFTIQGTYLWPGGGGIYCGDGSQPLIAYNLFDYCGAEFGGGIFCSESNPKIISNIFNHNWVGVMFYGRGGAIMLIDSAPLIVGNQFLYCWARLYGGAIYCETSNPVIKNNIFYENESVSGAALYLDLSNPRIINNVFYDNHADTGYGGAVCCVNQSNPLLVNNILFNDSALVGCELYADDYSLPVVYNSNIEGGWPGEGNIAVDPLFRDPGNGDFHLMATYCGDSLDSPCIDMGHPGILDTLLNCDWGLGTERSDMGAYSGGEGAVDVDESVLLLPQRVSLFQNYPNPFNASTIIRYELPRHSQVTIEVYDILGRRVSMLQDGLQPAGYHQVIWDAKDISSGVYFYKLQAGDNIETKKMMLLK